MKLSFERQTSDQENVANSIDRTKEGDLQKRMGALLPKTQEDYEAFQQNYGNQLWNAKNEGIIRIIKIAKNLLDEHGSSQIIQTNEKEILSEDDCEGYDPARVLAFCRIMETTKSN